MTVKAWLESRWYSAHAAPLPLRPLAALYGRIAESRRRAASASAPRLPVPVIVVGNIAVGGTGKTPFTLWLVERLLEWGWHPGIISRGYGGKAPVYPFRVSAASDPREAGDEPVMMARRCPVPLYVAPDRVAAARAVLAESEVDVLVCDDGLQHYALARDLEFCLVDGQRGLGNGALLPAGPLREPPSRLEQVDLVVVNGGAWRPPSGPSAVMQLRPGPALPLAGGAGRLLADFAGQDVHAVAGIGNPQRYFDMLQAQGLRVIPHAYADHHDFRRGDIEFNDGAPVLMTEKDAVKCAAFAGSQHWVVPVSASLDEGGTAHVRKLVEGLRPRQGN